MILSAASMLGSSGIFDKTSTVEQVNYSQFGSFRDAGMRPGAAAGALETKTETEVTDRTVSNMLNTVGEIGGAVTQGVGTIANQIKSATDGGYYSEDRVAKRKENRRLRSIGEQTLTPIAEQMTPEEFAYKMTKN